MRKDRTCFEDVPFYLSLCFLASCCVYEVSYRAIRMVGVQATIKQILVRGVSLGRDQVARMIDLIEINCCSYLIACSLRSVCIRAD